MSLLKKAVEIDKCVKNALSSQPDYSAAFTRRVGALAKRIETELAAPVEHDSDMNYGSGQKIVVWLNKDCRVVAPRSLDAAYRLEDHISTRGPFFTFVTLRFVPSNRGWKDRGSAKPEAWWVAVAENDIPDAMNPTRERVASIMLAEGYTHLDAAPLSETVEREMTQLDGKPATVFEVLFGEL
jgi:hypothetical protein